MNPMRWSLLVVGLLVSKALTACGSGGSHSSSGVCQTLAGEWSLSGTCLSASCTLLQNQCSFTTRCSDGSTMTGRISGSTVMLSGNGSECSGKLDPTSPGAPLTFTGSCESPGGKCTVSGFCESGDCARTIEPGQDGGVNAGGSGGQPPIMASGGAPLAAGGSSAGSPGAGGVIVGAGGVVVGAGGIVQGSGGSSGGSGGVVVDSGAGGCRPPTPDGRCEIVSRCGCSPSDNCTYVGTATSCVPPGATPLWSACTYSTECPAGSGCAGGVCRPVCADASDCGAPGATYRACYQVTNSSTGAPFPGFKVCTQQCNPMDPANAGADAAFDACGPDANCIVSSLGISGTTNCVAAGTVGVDAPCASTSECLPGLVCARGLSGVNVCARYCRIGHEQDDCPSATCSSGSGSFTMYGTCNALTSNAVGTSSGVVQYGYCTLNLGGC